MAQPLAASPPPGSARSMSALPQKNHVRRNAFRGVRALLLLRLSVFALRRDDRRRWPADVRLSGVEPRFVCSICGCQGADVRPHPDFGSRSAKRSRGKYSGQKARSNKARKKRALELFCAHFCELSQEPFPHCSVVERSLLACFRKLNSLRGSSTVKRPQQAELPDNLAVHYSQRE